MVLIKSKPQTLLNDSMFPSSFNSILNNFFEDRKTLSEKFSFMPAADIVEDEKAFEIRLSLPGIKKEEIKISLDGDHLTVEGERKTEITESTQKFIKKEINYGKFSRSFTIGKTDTTKIDAKFADGILSIVLPKAVDEKSSVIQIR